MIFPIFIFICILHLLWVYLFTNSQSDQLPKYDLFIMRVNMRFYLFAMLCTGPHEYFSLDNFVTCLTKTLLTDLDYMYMYVENKFT